MMLKFILLTICTLNTWAQSTINITLINSSNTLKYFTFSDDCGHFKGAEVPAAGKQNITVDVNFTHCNIMEYGFKNSDSLTITPAVTEILVGQQRYEMGCAVVRENGNYHCSSMVYVPVAGN